MEMGVAYVRVKKSSQWGAPTLEGKHERKHRRAVVPASHLAPRWHVGRFEIYAQELDGSFESIKLTAVRYRHYNWLSTKLYVREMIVGVGPDEEDA